MSRIAVLGSGAWGTALALSFARRSDTQVTLWAHAPQHAQDMLSTRENQRYLPGFRLPDHLSISSSLQQVVEHHEILLLVTPSQYLGETVQSIAPFLTAEHVLVSASKGLEEKTHRRMSQVIASITPTPVAVLSGPTFARELAAGMPTACVVASAQEEVARRLQTDLSSESLRIYRSTDVIGVELGGALKNVMALAAGITTGLGLGSNATAALISRGIAEVTRLAVACGAQPETLAGLAGMGDMVLTCTGPLSRNRSVGVELGQGKTLTEALAGLNGKVAEGVRCTSAALGLAQDRGVAMPITEQMFAVLHEGRSPQDAIRLLMTRPGGKE